MNKYQWVSLGSVGKYRVILAQETLFGLIEFKARFNLSCGTFCTTRVFPLCVGMQEQIDQWKLMEKEGIVQALH